MKNQLTYKNISYVIILGIAGGNGLNHITDNIKTIYGVDINNSYLSACKERYNYLDDKLILLNRDLTNKQITLPHADLVIADLFVEYIGYEMFCYHIKSISPEYISVVLQDEGSVKKLVSDTPYSNQLQPVHSVYTKIDGNELTEHLKQINYKKENIEKYRLPNGKEFKQYNFIKCY